MMEFEAGGVAHDGGHGEEPSGPSVETFIATNGVSQIHTFFGDSNTELMLGFTGITKFSHGHHARSGGGKDKFHFTNLNQVQSLIVGRLEDFDYSRDQIIIEGKVLDLNKLPANVRIVAFNGSHNDIGAEPQQWLSIKTSKGEIFYALEGARVDMTGNGGANTGDQESHFITVPVDTSKLKSVAYIDPMNVVPSQYQPSGGIIINDNDVTKADVLLTIRGSAFGDLIAGGLNSDTIQAGDGNDRAWGGSGNDKVYGENGNDIILGNMGNDQLFGGPGDDRMHGNTGNDTLYGGRGSDVMMGGDGDDALWGAEGNDRIYGGDGRDGIIAGDGDDVIFGYGGPDIIYGDAGNDNIKAGDGHDRVNGGTGNDFLNGQQGNDLVSGADGSDTIYGDYGSDILRGDAGTDLLFGGADQDTLFGGSGNDSLNGGNGFDKIVGGAGADRLRGGFGEDAFIFTASSDSGLGQSNRDVILDFQRGLDKIDLSRIDADLTSSGDQSFGFRATQPYNNADDRGDVRLNPFNGGVGILIDVDGDGGTDMTIIVANVSSLTLNDFIL